MSTIQPNTLHLGDCLEVMKEIADGSVDMVLCDLPYGTTACKWDSVIPFEPLWVAYRRVCKVNAAIVLNAAQPFTSALVMSNVKAFKYCWVWIKNTQTGIALAKYQPMRGYEDIAVFCTGQHTYNKQPTLARHGRKVGTKNGRKRNTVSDHHSSMVPTPVTTLPEYVNPRNVLEFDVVPHCQGTLHPTQKPVALMEYLIRTYTNDGEVVLDNTMGSGTTCLAAKNTNRRYIGIEQDPTYYEIARQRVEGVAAPTVAPENVATPQAPTL